MSWPLRRATLLWLLAGSFAVCSISLFCGAVRISAHDVLAGQETTGGAVFWNLRLPRVVLGFLSGGILGICGASLQGLFRNPLADPALIGISGGAALGAVIAIVTGGSLAIGSPWILPFAAFSGALGATIAVHMIATAKGRVMVSTLLLAGIAINAVSGAAMGWLIYGASDQQLRDFTFWSLGSLSGAGWPSLIFCLPFSAAALLLLVFRGRALNALSLGEGDAWHLGAPVEGMKISILVASALGVGAITAFTGTIGFIGLVAPHVVRIAGGADHRFVLPASFLAGGLLLSIADVAARMVRIPAEIPIGVVVATVGAPFFLMLLLRGRGHVL